MNRMLPGLRRRWWALGLAALLLLGGYWLLPISGQVLILPGRGALPWPQMRLLDGEAVLQVTDPIPWTYVAATINGETVRPARWWRGTGGTWTWEWDLGAMDVPEGATIVFYHDCRTGCVERGRMVTGEGMAEPAAAPSVGPATKLGAVFANPKRDWHGRSGWAVELSYARLAEAGYWGIDALAARVHALAAQNLRVLVRVDYDRGQSLPPSGDYAALSEYLAYLQRLARDARLYGVYGYVIGSGYNAPDANMTAPEAAVTPAWYARVFNGAGEPAARTDNVVQVIRAENPAARVLVGPVRPWCGDQGGEADAGIGAPWLDYMDALVAALDEGVRAKAAAGVALAGPDGFALQVAGRPGAPELAGRNAAEEPRQDLARAEWGGAQAGFRVYRDWMDIINAYPATRGLPLYITSANTYAPDEGVPPAQNYPSGWLTAALAAINEEPQIQALCWFIDGPLGDTQWDGFSLSRAQGQMAQAANEFDALLRKP